MSQDPVAIITAASRGIGAACARALGERGMHLVLMSTSEAIEETGAALGALTVRGSVAEDRDIARLVDTARAAHGRVDVVVNNTGHAAKGSLLEISDAEWHAGMDLLLLNVVRMARLITPMMQSAGGGAIVNISTFAAAEPSPRFPISAAMRAALAGFTKMYAEAHAAHNIRMNNVLPGFVDSIPVDDATRATIPMGRPAAVAEVAQTVAFLASSGGAYITGQNIRVDGGLTRSMF